MSDGTERPAPGSEPEAPQDTPVFQRKATWAAISTTIFGLMLAAPELARNLLPFVPDSYRERVIAGAAVLSVVAGILANRSAAGNAHRAAQAGIREVKREIRER